MIEISYEYNIDNYYDMFELIGEKNRIYPPSLFNKWFFFEEKSKKRNGKIAFHNEKYTTLVQVDQETFNGCYCRLFNPLQIYLSGGTGKYLDKECIGVMDVMIYTIDDAAYGCRFEDVERVDFEKLFEIIDNWVKTKQYINSNELIRFLESLGGKDNSW